MDKTTKSLEAQKNFLIKIFIPFLKKNINYEFIWSLKLEKEIECFELALKFVSSEHTKNALEFINFADNYFSPVYMPSIFSVKNTIVLQVNSDDCESLLKKLN